MNPAGNRLPRMQTPAPESLDDGAAPSVDALEEALIELDPTWIVLAQLRLGTPPDDLSADYVLLHRGRGIALLDRAPGNGRDPIPPFRKFLDAEGFSGFFPGTLPIVYSIVDPGEGALGKRLDEAFAAAPELTIADAEWAEAVNSLLVAPEPQAGGAEDGDADAEDDAGAADIAGMPSFRPSRGKSEAEDWTDGRAAMAAADRRPAGPPLRYAAADDDDALAPRPLPPLRSPIEDQPIYLKRRRPIWPAVLVLLVCLAGGAAAWLLVAPTTDSDVAALVGSAPANPPPGTPIPDGAKPEAASPATPSPATAPPPAVPDIPPVPAAPPKAAEGPATPAPTAPQTPPSGKLAAPAPPLDQHDVATANRPPSPAAKPAEKPPQTPAPAAADIAEQLVPKASPPPAETAPLAVVPAAKPAPQVAAESPHDSGRPDNPAPAAAPRRSAEQHQPAAHPARAAHRTPAASERPASERPTGERKARTRPERAVAHAEPAQTKERRPTTANPPATAPAAPQQAPQPPQYSGPPIDAGQLPPLAAEQPLPAPQPPPAPAEEQRPAPRNAEAAALGAPIRLFPSAAPDDDAPPPARHPPTAPRLAAAPASGAASGSNGVCRIYHAVTTVMGQQRPVKGLACRRADGTWQVVTQAPE